MDKVTVDGTGSDTVVRVHDPRKVQAFGVSAYEQANVPHDEMTKIFLQWLREIPSQQQMLVIAGIVMEHQVSYHLNAKSEEERIEELNMDEYNITGIIVENMLQLAQPQHEGGPKYVDVGELGRTLQALHLALPPKFVWGFLKGLEFYHPAFTVTDVDEGFVMIKEVEHDVTPKTD